MAVVVTVAKGYDLDYIWTNQGQVGAERTAGGYYINAAQAGEPPGRWWGRGAAALGFSAGQVVERKPYEAVYRQLNPSTGAALGRPRRAYATFADHLARLKTAEPHATAERLVELEREAAQATRQPAAYTDVTVSFSKSISVLHASIRENTRRARLAGDEKAARYWTGQEQRFQAVLHQANTAALEYAQEWAGFTRTGYHGTRVHGSEPGKFSAAGLVVSSWLQGTSRDGDPQDHVHNQVARMTWTFSDGKWRALDTASLRGVLGALQAVAATTVECELTRQFGVRWVPRPDGRGNEIQGITQAQMDAYSTRTVRVHEKERDLARAWERRYGRVPNSRELSYLAQKATLYSRGRKDAGTIDWDALTQRWDATLGGELAAIARSVSALRGPGTCVTRAGGAPSRAVPTRRVQEQAVSKALALLSAQQPTWTRHDLLKQLALVMPAQTRQMSTADARQLLHGLTEDVLAGRLRDAVCVEAPLWPPLPDALRRELDGRSVYTRPGTARYATTAQLAAEEQLIAGAQAQTAPRLPSELAARRLGADADLLYAQLHAHGEPMGAGATRRGLRLDQAAAAWHALTSARTVEVITGPAGTGKTRVLAAIARAWAPQRSPGQVFGTATSQNATNELRTAGVQVAENITRLLAAIGDGTIPPGSLIVVDEASMVSLAHLADLVRFATAGRCKLVLAGDQEQLPAVEGSGALMLLAARLGYVQLTEPVRFTARWEREASLRLRSGDATALDDYDYYGRITGAQPDEAMDQAATAYVAAYLTGRDVVLQAADWARCRELSQRIRDDLIHLGLVDPGRVVQIAEGVRASAGDLIICRRNDHAAMAGEPGRALANGDILRVEAITGNSVMVRRQLSPDPVTGQRRFTGQAFPYRGYQTSDLAYAVTGHSAQGGTVHTGIVVVSGNEDRHWLYPAMTRGTDLNIAFVFTTPARPADLRPGTRPAPELGRYERTRRQRDAAQTAPPLCQPDPESADPREPVAVLADVLGRDGSRLSALQTRDRNLTDADHLAILNAIWAAETRDAHDRRYREIVTAALPPRHRQGLSHRARWLFRTLRAAELAGLDPAEVARSAIDARRLAGARDVAAVIDTRIRQRIDPLLPLPRNPWSLRVPHLADPAREAYLTQIAAMMDDRKQRLGQHTACHKPAWAIAALGPVPADASDRTRWEARASSVAAYREAYGYDHATDPIGPEPSRQSPDQRAAWHEALSAFCPGDGPHIRGMLDGQLWLIRDSYATETGWAPPHVGRELRLVRLGARNADQSAIRAAAEGDAARKAHDMALACRHDILAASYRAMRDRYQEQETILAAAMTNRQEWEHATRHSRRLATAADAELRRRHPHRRIGALRSAEPVPVGDTDRAQFAPAPDRQTVGMPEWITELAAQRAAFRDKLNEHQNLLRSSEDPGREPLGAARSTVSRPAPAAILQPPEPQMRPAAAVLRLARQQDSAAEATR